MKHVICYSGGHSSALVAIEVTRRFGEANVILVNHDIHPSVEHPDIKRFKREVAAYLQIPITFVNMDGVDRKDQFDVVMDARAFKVGNGTALCTNRLKTRPFDAWLEAEFPGGAGCIIYYGFDAHEKIRMIRRSSILGERGYATDFPLALWKRTIKNTYEIGIDPPLTYAEFRHANCVGCLKAGKQHWYVVFCTRPDLWSKAKLAEEEIGYSILKEGTLEEAEADFKAMRCAGVEASERLPPQTFWAQVRRKLKEVEADDEDSKPCECVI